IQMRVGDQNVVNLAAAKREGFVIPFARKPLALKEAAIHENGEILSAHQITGTGDLLRSAKKGNGQHARYINLQSQTPIDVYTLLILNLKIFDLALFLN